ncbi:MAG: GGDEF domain-containing protein [Acidobacteriota bacterium]|nr:GGDEF domain-containing protein [Acidobacteriota bacterium]
MTAGENLLRTAVDCYLSAIFLFAECLEAVRPEIAMPYRDNLIRLRRRLAFDATTQTLLESRESLCNELARFTVAARAHRQVKSEDLSAMLGLLAHAGDAFALSKDGFEDQFRHLSRHVRAPDGVPNEVTQRLSQDDKLRTQLSSLEQFVGAVYEQNSEVFSRMQEQMEDAQVRLHDAEALAAIDPLTGLGNRRELDRQLELRIAKNRPFCLLLLDIDQFKAINDEHGHLCGDQVLKQAAARVLEQIRARDFVCRWGGDEFVILLESGLANASVRSRQIAAWLSGPYRIPTPAGDLTLNLNVSTAAAEHVPGESPDQLFHRVDQLLYRSKPDQKAMAC